MGVVILSVYIVFPEKVSRFYFEQLGNLHKIAQIWLASICAPFRYGGFVLSQLFTKLFVRFLLFCKNNF